jgi:hypothetical protein
MVLVLRKAIKHLKLKKAYTGMSLSVYKDKAGDAGLGAILVNLGFNAVVKTRTMVNFQLV